MSLIYRGISSDDVKFNVTERRVYNAPAFDVTGIEVPGRSGDILNSQERFKNKSVVYTGFIRSSDFPGDTTWERLSRGLRTIKAWVCGDAGKYHDLTDDYDPGFVRRAFVSGETAISEVLDRPDGATITITFMTEPFMYEESDPIELPETGTASGAIASFEGVAAPLQSLIFSISPQQDLHGYDYPWPGGGGVNMAHLSDGTRTGQGCTGTVASEVISVSGTASATYVNATWMNDITIVSGESYTVRLSKALTVGITFRFATDTTDTTYQQVSVNAGYTSAVFTANNNFAKYRIYVSGITSGTVINISDLQILVGKGIVGSFSPYSNISPISGWSQVDGKQSGEDMTDYTPITISLGQTVYGGTVDALQGEGTVTFDDVDLGTLTWTYRSDVAAGLFSANLPGYKFTSDVQAICSNYKYVGTVAGTSFAGGKDNASFCLYVAQGQSSRVIYVKDTAYTSAADFKTAMSGVKVVYELASPTTLSLTPVSGLTSLLGQNNVWCNTGDTEVVYVEPTENPTEWPSKPRLEITMAGAGTLTVNGKTWSIGAYTGTLICDSEIMDWYDASNLKNSLVSGDGFPELQPGENVITYTGGITKVVAKPRWRTL